MSSTISRDTFDNVVVVTRDGNTDATFDGKVKNLVYNPVTMAWEAATQAGGGGTSAADSTAANQVIGNASLASIDTKLTSQATAANQTSELTKLDTLITNTNKIPSSPATDRATAAAPASVRLSDGSAFISTLPVSGPLTDTQLRASAVPVSGTLNAAQSGTWTVQPGNTANTTAWKVDGSAVTQPVSGTVTVTPPTITKATQGPTGFSTQDLKDAGRSARTIFLDSFAVTATAETLMTMSYSTDNATVTTGTSYAVTAGKRFRVQQILASLHTIAGNTTAVAVIVRIRVNNGGAALVSSPIQMVIPIQGIAAANQAGFPVEIPFPDGWEFVAGAGIGVTTTCAGFVATTAAPKVDITITGYEY